jgi:response regulator RpfG family c-di-GMP phosphodiesterase
MTTLFSKILIVDDEIAVCEALKEFFEEKQYNVELAHDGEDALDKLSSFNPQCVLMDVRMPYLSGVEALKMIKMHNPDIAVIMVSAVSNMKIVEECMRSGAFGYVLKPVDLDHLEKELDAALNHHHEGKEKRKKQDAQNNNLITEKQKLENLNKTLNRDLYQALKFPFRIIKNFHPEFGCHSHNVAWLSKEIATFIKIPFVWRSSIASYYHDIGKLSFPEDMWDSFSDEWSDEKKELYRQFPLLGQELLLSHPELSQLGKIIRHQCEHFDGSGYPDSISGEDIPIESRIIAVSNAFDEILKMGNRRNIHQDICEGGKALEVLQKGSGKKYDPKIIQALLEIINKYKFTPSRENRMILNDLTIGMVLSRDLITKSGRLALPRNVPLTSTLIKKVHLLTKIDPIINDCFIHLNINE